MGAGLGWVGSNVKRFFSEAANVSQLWQRLELDRRQTHSQQRALVCALNSLFVHWGGLSPHVEAARKCTSGLGHFGVRD